MAASCVLVLSACTWGVPLKDINVTIEADPKAKFSGYKTYTWLGSTAILNDAEGLWEPPGFDADAHVKYLIDRELRNRGMEENRNDPDMGVAFALGVDMDALGLKTDPKTKMAAMKNVPKGALVVALVDTETGFVIWMGTATAEVQKDIDEEAIKKRLDFAVTRMFWRMPE
ncbi:MAG: DUF4136 domain-containing protein [Thermodesulfobacteriota bacterium]